MARRKKLDSEKLSEVVRLRLSPTEAEQVKANASNAGLSVSEFLRRRALSIPVQPSSAKADAAMLNEVNRIGVNVNQLAQSVNRGRDFVTPWQAVLVELKQVLSKVSAVYDP